MDLYPYQHLFFTTLEYEQLRPAFHEQPHAEQTVQLDELHDKHVLLLTGIASPQQMEHDLAPYTSQLTPLTFGDHHAFKKKDVERINELFASLSGQKLIITTEKDATRLMSTEGLSDEVKKHLYILPIHISMMQNQTDDFNKNIFKYVRKNSRNGILAKGKDDHKPKDSDSTGDRPRTISFRNN
jgi:tetraacyldisaccharide 4'-kinase